MPLSAVYEKIPVEICSGSGTLIWDRTGKEYLDFYGGHGVISLGHCHSGIRKALLNQYDLLPYYSNVMHNPLQEQLADLLCKVSGYHDYLNFFVNSGSEAVENALKISVMATGRKKIIAIKSGFHGRTSHAAFVSDACPFKGSCISEELVSFIDLEDFESTHKEIHEGVAAVILEGVQGVGGVQVPSEQFLIHLRELCNRSGVMLILDEIQSGMGRSGTFFSHKQSGINADMITLAKGLGNGFPIGVVMYQPGLTLSKGSLGSTFGGGHLACAVGLEVTRVVEALLNSGEIFEKSRMLLDGLQSAPLILEVLGKGLMLGIKSGAMTSKLHRGLLHRGVISGMAAKGTELRLLPPLTVSSTEINTFLDKYHQVCKEVVQ